MKPEKRACYAKDWQLQELKLLKSQLETLKRTLSDYRTLRVFAGLSPPVLTKSTKVVTENREKTPEVVVQTTLDELPLKRKRLKSSLFDSEKSDFVTEPIERERRKVKKRAKKSEYHQTQLNFKAIQKYPACNMDKLPAPCKRHFIPTFDSFFNETKRKKLNTLQVQEVTREYCPNTKPLSTETKELTDILTRPKFKAKPVPKSTYLTPACPIALKTYDKQAAPVPEERHLTLPMPFRLHTQDRGVEKESRRRQEIESQALEDQRRRQFVARPMPSYTSSRECSQETRPVTIPEPFSLHSSQRSEERQVFDQRMRRKEEARQQAQARELAERQRQEAVEMRQLRQKTVFKAQPIFHPRTTPSEPLSQASSFLSQDFSFFNE